MAKTKSEAVKHGADKKAAAAAGKAKVKEVKKAKDAEPKKQSKKQAQKEQNPFESKPDANQSSISMFVKKNIKEPDDNQESKRLKTSTEQGSQSAVADDAASSSSAQPLPHSKADGSHVVGPPSSENATNDASPAIDQSKPVDTDIPVASDKAKESLEGQLVSALAGDCEDNDADTKKFNLFQIIEDAKASGIKFDSDISLSSVVAFWKDRAASDSHSASWKTELDSCGADFGQDHLFQHLKKQAKDHIKVTEYITHLTSDLGVPNDEEEYTFLGDDGDPGEDMNDFIRWLVQHHTDEAKTTDAEPLPDPGQLEQKHDHGGTDSLAPLPPTEAHGVGT
eukprot:Skav213506  [mRNA]  locus=scaffold3094:82368:83381:+ [translate_table: standard]